MYELRPDAPLDPVSVAITAAVAAAANAAGTRMVIVGATARDIVLSHIYGIPLYRATADLDFAVAIPGWEAFNTVIRSLQGDERFRSDHVRAHRLYFRHAIATYDIPVDIVPFGEGVGGPKFRWPDDPDVEMNVSGYLEADKAALSVDIAGLSVNVLNVAGLALLKVFAWVDRRAMTRKDASDLLVLMRHYPDVGNADRMYEDPHLLDGVGHDYLRGGARLLARDVRDICGESTLNELRVLLTDENIEKIAEDASRESAAEGLPIGEVTRLFEDFATEIHG
jgi:predicted nucleotidyltransferase